MTVETNANFLSGLNKAYPRNRDLIKEGDDHIRLIKAVLQNTFPGMDKGVTASSDKLNKLDATLVYEEETLKSNSGLIIAEKEKVDMGGNIVTNCGDPEEPMDAVNLRSLQGSLMWPVGSIFMTVDSRNPNEILGFGVWEKFAAGRVIIGTGTTTDDQNETKTFINEGKGGSFGIKLSVEQLPAHGHPLEGGETAEDGAHRHAFRQLQIAKPSPDTKHDGNMAQYDMTTYYTETDGAHSHKLKGTSGNTGGGEVVSLVQPYIGCNIWMRKPDEVTP